MVVGWLIGFWKPGQIIETRRTTASRGAEGMGGGPRAGHGRTEGSAGRPDS